MVSPVNHVLSVPRYSTVQYSTYCNPTVHALIFLHVSSRLLSSNPSVLGSFNFLLRFPRSTCNSSLLLPWSSSRTIHPNFPRIVSTFSSPVSQSQIPLFSPEIKCAGTPRSFPARTSTHLILVFLSPSEFHFMGFAVVWVLTSME